MLKLATALLEITPPSSPASNRIGSSECELCVDGWIVIAGQGARQCECLKRKIRQRAIDKIPTIYRNLTLETIAPRPERHPAQSGVIAGLRQHADASFAFFGVNGCGKSMFGWLLYRRAIDQGRLACALPLSELLAEFREWEKNPDKLPSIKPEDLRQDKRPYLLFLDELEKARPTEYAGEMLFRLIDAAYSFNHQLVIATNKTPNDLCAHWSANGDTYGPSIIRRILEMENGFEVPMFSAPAIEGEAA